MTRPRSAYIIPQNRSISASSHCFTTNILFSSFCARSRKKNRWTFFHCNVRLDRQNFINGYVHANHGFKRAEKNYGAPRLKRKYTDPFGPFGAVPSDEVRETRLIFNLLAREGQSWQIKSRDSAGFVVIIFTMAKCGPMYGNFDRYKLNFSMDRKGTSSVLLQFNLFPRLTVFQSTFDNLRETISMSGKTESKRNRVDWRET